MTDIVDKATRSKMMASIKGKNTRPELAVRKYLHAAGLRFRLHAIDLPARPDIVFRSRRIVVFVHGCFWHRHKHCRFAYVPKTRKAFWTNKLSENVTRDQRAQSQLTKSGWSVITVWECEIGSTRILDRVAQRISATPKN